MDRSTETPVLIVGAGPVGLTLAMDLASRGIDVTMAETRRASEPPNVKCNQVSARSMEIFRRLGLAKKIRDTGLPEEYRNDVSCCVTATGMELSRIKLPSRAGRACGEQGDDSWWPTPEPPHRINQLFLEPVLFAMPRRSLESAFSIARNSRNCPRIGRASPRLRRISITANGVRFAAAISWAATEGARPCGTPSAPG